MSPSQTEHTGLDLTLDMKKLLARSNKACCLRFFIQAAQLAKLDADLNLVDITLLLHVEKPRLSFCPRTDYGFIHDQE